MAGAAFIDRSAETFIINPKRKTSLRCYCLVYHIYIYTHPCLSSCSIIGQSQSITLYYRQARGTRVKEKKETYLIISSLTSYSLAVGNKEQMRWSIDSTLVGLLSDLSVWRISCIMSDRLLLPDWRKTLGELGAEAKPLLACRTMASRLAWVAG
jgi:hypothetical protein